MYVPEKYYVGFQSQGQDSLVGFFTPDDGDEKSRKRKQTVDNWSNSKFQAATITNEPCTGFRIVDTARRSRTQNVLFRIIHPEVGAEFEISAENLNELHQQCIIEYGEVKTELLFVRDGTNNILVVKDSKEHKKALKDMEEEKAKKASVAKINKKDIVPGTVLSVSSFYGDVYFMGKHKVSFITREGDYYSEQTDFIVDTPEDKFLVFKPTDKNSTQLILRKSWPKIDEVRSKVVQYVEDEVLSTISNIDIGHFNSSKEVYDIVFDEVLNISDYEVQFVESKKCTMKNIDSWNYHRTLAVFDDGSYATVYPRHCYDHQTRKYEYKLEYECTYKLSSDLKVTKTPNQSGGVNWYSQSRTLYITDPNTILYTMKIVKKEQE